MIPTLLLCWELVLFWALQELIKAVNRVLPFSKRHLVRVLAALYIFGNVGNVVTEHLPFWNVITPLFVVCLYLSMNTERETTIFLLPVALFRLGVFLTSSLFAGFLLWVGFHWLAFSCGAFAVLQYAVAMPGGPPRQRRRLLDPVQETVGRPGYSTAFSGFN